MKNGVIHYNGEKETLKHFPCRDVNTILSARNREDRISTLIGECSGAFADPNESLPYNTKIVGTIRTTNDDPVYSKAYPYPMASADFVNKEISDLLRDGIIRPSRSPYNNPLWVVGKKGITESGERKMRLVVDFRKLNEKTVSDRYPIPDTSVILANLGRSSLFTTLDLKSGFHQIKLAERDREKTAFSINNGKYEFCRLPFGLKNAPSIFQRAIGDVLREEIGKCCHVYVDDVIIFSKDEDQHVMDIKSILGKLYEANMRVSLEKSKFMKSEVEFLGFVVSSEEIKTCPDKVQDIVKYETPKTLRALRSFLGLSGYYRRFVKDYALIAKPLTRYLRGENGNVSANRSKNIYIQLDEDALRAFEKIKKVLASEDVLLLYPDFEKQFDLTTDASSHALGAVLSQGGRPITMISRTLSATEENYATNERQLLAIVRSLQKLRNYLYGVKQLNIYTDHQPLTFAISDRNPNAKLKRWRAFVEEFSPKFFYKPGKDNVVADALSRQHINGLEDSDSSTGATVHSEESLTQTIPTIQNPINCFKSQIIIEEGNSPSKTSKIIFRTQMRHHIVYNDRNELLKIVGDCISPSAVNGLLCDYTVLAQIQDEILTRFPSVKFRHTMRQVIDVTNEDDQREILETEHNRAHRSLKENLQQILKEYYFPKIQSRLK